MSAYDDIASRLDFQQLADQVGAEPDEVERAVHSILPALVGGMQANAADPGGADALLDAVTHHDNGLADGVNGLVDVGRVDTDDGSKITRHVFGDNTDQVINQLGAGSGGSGLVAKLLPILAPIVLSYLAKQMGQSGGSGGGILGSILGSILSGAATGSGGGRDEGLGLDDLLGGLLGGGTRR